MKFHVNTRFSLVNARLLKAFGTAFYAITSVTIDVFGVSKRKNSFKLSFPEKKRCLRYDRQHLISLKCKLFRQFKNFVFSSLSTNKTAGKANLKKSLGQRIIKTGSKASRHLESKLSGAFNFMVTFSLKSVNLQPY